MIQVMAARALVGQPDLRPDRPADLWRHDERHAAVGPAVRLHGLHHGARGAGRPHVPQRPAGVSARAGVARGDHAAGVRVLGHRVRHRRRRRRADGRHRDAADAQRRLRREAGVGGDHGGRDARHPDPAVGHADRLRGGGRTVDRQALRGGDAAGLLPHVPLPRVHPRLGDHQSQNRAEAAARSVSREGARVPRPARAWPGPPRRGRPARGRVPSGPASRRHWTGRSRDRLPRDRPQRPRALRAVAADRRHVRGDVVVRGRLQRPRGGDGRRARAHRDGHDAGHPGGAGNAADGDDRRAPRGEAAGARRGRGVWDGARRGCPEDRGPRRGHVARDPTAVSDADRIPALFYGWFWRFAAASALLLFVYYWRMDGEQLEILKELCASVVPLGVLTVVVLAVILFGICTATESAAVGAAGALYLAVMAKFMRPVLWWSLIGFVVGITLGVYEGEDFASLLVAGAIGGTLFGTVVRRLWHLRSSPELRQHIDESPFLTAQTTAMRCWLFVGSALFSAVFALHGGQGLIERWVLSMNLSPLGFQLTAQAIIFLLGWPLEWTEIIVIFCPIFIPLLAHFNVDPILFGTMVAVNLQAAFLSPPVAMSAFYLKGVSPRHVTLNQIFAGMMPYMLIVCICLVFMYIWPGMTLWLPEFLYGK